MPDLALPTPIELAAERDPSKRLIALLEPATNMLIRATALDEVNEIRSRAAALERYARSIRLSTEAIRAAQTIARRAEVRMGELSGPAEHGGDRRSANFKSQPTELKRHDLSDFRALADHATTVEEVLGDPECPATRSAVLHAIKREGMEEWAREVEARTEDGAVEVMELQRALRRALVVLRRMRSNGRTFEAAPLARRVVELCRQIEEVLT